MLAISVLSAGLASSFTALAVTSQLPRETAATTPAATPQVIVASTGTSSTSATAADPTDPVVTAAAATGPAVVTITSSVSVSRGRQTATGTGVGSGFLYSSDGLILTNAHVVEGATSLSVQLADGRKFTGTVVTSDTAADLAVVKIDATGLPTVVIGTSSTLQVGQTVIAIGSPLGTYTDSVTSGILSGTSRDITVTDDQTGQPRQLTNLLQTDAAINPGNSGGPLLDVQGQVIGINTATAGNSEGLGFAIPIDAARALMASAKAAAA